MKIPLPVVPDYIAECFLKICEGLSHKANFVRYTYREEMVMDAVENCLKQSLTTILNPQHEQVNLMRLHISHKYLGMLFYVELRKKRNNKISR